VAAKILVVRGGAIGDFILTLPALNLLREAFPDAHIELLGYPHILALADRRYYADAIRSIESRELAAFFNPKAELDPAWCEYFSSFKQVVSYLFDPDGFFEGNLKRAGVKHLMTGSPKITDRSHAAVQLAEPLQRLALFLETPVAKIHPTDSDRTAAASVLGEEDTRPMIALHPGSGGKRKNWPLANWTAVTEWLHDSHPTHRLLVIGGESDEEELDGLRQAKLPVEFLENLPLPTLGAILERAALFVGHDSGISHLAGAAGAPCLLLFGPTDPAIWGPAGEHVSSLAAPGERMEELSIEDVSARISEILDKP